MNRHDIPALLADLDDLCARMRDADLPTGILVTLALARSDLYLLAKLPPPEPDSRPSSPPGLFEENQRVRQTAKDHFRKAREHTSEAVRRLRRER